MIASHPSASWGSAHGEEVSTAFAPGGWGDQLIFGYMFRVVVSVFSVMFTGVLIFICGAINGWVLTDGMVIFFGILVAIMVLIGEALRVGAYESSVHNRTKYSQKEDYSNVTVENLERVSRQSVSYRVTKRAIDLAISVPALFVIFPLISISALLVRFDSPGPAFYRQRRIGFGGKEIMLLKLRTRAFNTQKGQEPPVTRAGRILRATSVDELPTLINVMMGSLSLVGPRPLPIGKFRTADEAGENRNDIRMQLLKYAKPGITGISVSERSRNEDVLSYLERRSTWVDLSILVSTARLVVHRNAF